MIKKNIGIIGIIGMALLASVFANAGHLECYEKGNPDDPTIARAKTMPINVPLMCREFHVWWNTPFGENSASPQWQHWTDQKMYGKYNPATTIEQLRPGSSWQRWLNSTGYPLLGPYDPGSKDIIRWQLQTAKNAGLECLHVQLWPSIWNDGTDITPQPTWERVLDVAAELNFPVAVHDEAQFRRSNISGAQKLENAIRRTANFIKRYGQHPGFYKINGMPYYYFQNWVQWMKPADLAVYVKEVEKEAGPVYWVVEQGPDEKVYSIPEIKELVGPHAGSFISANPLKPYPWDKVDADMKQAAELAHKYNKKFSALVYTRFNNTHYCGDSVLSGEHGNFMLDSIEHALKANPDAILLTQWNDFEECAYIEPAWDFDGFDGDPYFYCRLVATLKQKEFKLAPLPRREALDPYIRSKLFEDVKAGDIGPVGTWTQDDNGKFTVAWAADGAKASEVRYLQKNLIRWTPANIKYNTSDPIRLANYSEYKGRLLGDSTMMFYLPGLIGKQNEMTWVGVRAFVPASTRLKFEFSGDRENYRVDSRWERRCAHLENGICVQADKNTSWYWIPLYNARFFGSEGDLTIRLEGARGPTVIEEVIVWTPALPGEKESDIDVNKAFVAVGYDKTGNAGMPALLVKKVQEAAMAAEQHTPEAGEVYYDGFEKLVDWKVVSNGSAEIVKYDPRFTSSPFFSLSNSAAAKSIKTVHLPLELKCSLLHTAYQRGQWVGLFDSATGNGYAVFWDSSVNGNNKENGFIVLAERSGKIDKFDFFSDFQTRGALIDPGHNAITEPLAQLVLAIDIDGNYTVSVDGQVRGRGQVKNLYKTFDLVVLRGNEFGYFDDLAVIQK